MLSIFKSVTLAAPGEEMTGTAVVMEQWSAQHRACIVEIFLKMLTLLKCSEYFASISILLVTVKFLAEISYSYGLKISERVFPH
jgi:hypothetical protein